MSYKVIKKIKGNLYLYLQTSFRAGGKVKTKSVYLGAVSGDGATASNRPQEAREEAKAHQTPPQSKTSTETPPRRPESEPGESPAKGRTTTPPRPAGGTATGSEDATRSKLKIKIKLEHHRISENGLLSVLKNQISTLQGVGLDTSKLSKIKLVYSSVNEIEPRHKKSLLSSDYKVYIPAYRKGNRTKFLQEYRRAVAKQGLDLVRSEDPVLYSQIKTAFDESYRRTNQALSSYLLATTDKNKSVKAFIVRFFGIYHGKLTGTQQAEDLGLTDTTRETWTDEYADIMGDIAKRGYETVLNEWEARHYQATVSEKRATTARFRRDTKRKWYNYLQVGYMDRANASLRRAIAKRQAQSEAVEKIKIIGKLYKLENTGG